MQKVPKDFPVKVLRPGTKKYHAAEQARKLATCGHCGRSWDDSISTQWTPVPGARCPFEYFHDDPAEDGPTERELLNNAAPDLLEALQAWQAFWDNMPKGQLGKLVFDVGLLNDAFLKMGKAITKAKGGPKQSWANDRES